MHFARSLPSVFANVLLGCEPIEAALRVVLHVNWISVSFGTRIVGIEYRPTTRRAPVGKRVVCGIAAEDHQIPGRPRRVNRDTRVVNLLLDQPGMIIAAWDQALLVAARHKAQTAIFRRRLIEQ